MVSALLVRQQIIFLKFFSALLLTAFYFAGWQMIATSFVVASYAVAACLMIGPTFVAERWRVKKDGG